MLRSLNGSNAMNLVLSCCLVYWMERKLWCTISYSKHSKCLNTRKVIVESSYVFTSETSHLCVFVRFFRILSLSMLVQNAGTVDCYLRNGCATLEILRGITVREDKRSKFVCVPSLYDFVAQRVA